MMNDLMLQDSGALTISDSDRIRIAAAWEALSVNSRRSYQGAWDRCGQWLTDRGISLDDLSDEVMARFRPDGSYVQNSFSVLGTPGDVDPRGMTLAGNQVFVLDATRILALDRGFAYVASENVAVSSADPVSVGWNGNALLVYDAGVATFYGGEQPALASVPSMPPRQYRSRAFKKYEETLDVMKRNADGTLMKRGIGVKGLRFSTIEEVYVSESADLTTQLRLFTIILLRPLPEIEVDDFIFRNTGATEGNPPMDLPPGRYQVKGFGEWGDRYKQVLYCVRVRGDGEADALAGAHSPLRVRNRR